MKNTMKMILALVLALTMICALGAPAFADNMPTVTKNPVNESHYAGETATFIADARSYDGIEWYFLAPNGNVHDLNAFKAQFPACTVTGQGTTTLRIANLQTGMNGWEVYCGFTLGSACVTTTCASIGVIIPTGTPTYTAPTTTTTTTYVTTPVYVPDPVYVCDPVYVTDTVYVCDPIYVPDPVIICDPVYDYEPDYVEVNNALVYADGTVIPDADEPDCVQIGGQLYCSDGSVRPGNCDTDYVWVDSARIYSDGSIVCD